MNENWMLRILKERAAQKPEEKVLFDSRTAQDMTWQQLLDAVIDTKNTLVSQGICPRDRIVLMMDNCFAFAIAFWAITACGAIVVPVNTGLKTKELSFIIGDVNANGVLMHDTYLERLDLEEEEERYTAKLQLFEGVTFFKRSGSVGDLDESVAMLMFTSGTTGNPKGVILSYDNLLAKTGHIIDAHQLTDQDRVLCVLPWFHINGLVITLLTGLVSDQKIIIGGKFSVSRFWKDIQTYQATWFSGVPTMYSHLLARGIPEKEVYKSLRFARSASSALPAAVRSTFEETCGVPIIESYGITEGCAQITTNPLPPRARKQNSVGLAFGNEVKVMRPDGTEADVYESGEVWIKGENITRGYYHRPEENKKTFTGEWFHSGDVGYLDEEGYLFLNGRIKELINRAGEKFSPLEVDEVLYRIPEVELAAAVGVPDPVYGEEVVCYIKTKPGMVLTEETVQEWCRSRLAHYKVPRKVLFTENIPQGGNGKIQRLKLVERYPNAD